MVPTLADDDDFWDGPEWDYGYSFEDYGCGFDCLIYYPED